MSPRSVALTAIVGVAVCGGAATAAPIHLHMKRTDGTNLHLAGAHGAMHWSGRWKPWVLGKTTCVESHAAHMGAGAPFGPCAP